TASSPRAPRAAAASRHGEHWLAAAGVCPVRRRARSLCGGPRVGPGRRLVPTHDVGTSLYFLPRFRTFTDPEKEWVGMPEDSLQILSLGVGLVGLLHAILLLIWTHENTRFFRRRLSSPVVADFTPRVQLFLPCKGVEFSFEDTVRSILNLDYPSYRVTFIVESPIDPAYARLKQLLAGSHRGVTQVLVAGYAQDCGQKVHNLLAASAELDEGVEVLAFVDSDIVPGRDFLHRLVAPLRRDKSGVVTGYRWFLAQPDD